MKIKTDEKEFKFFFYLNYNTYNILDSRIDDDFKNIAIVRDGLQYLGGEKNRPHECLFF